MRSYNSDPLHSKTTPFWHQTKLIHLSGGKAALPPLNLDLVYLIWIDLYFVLFKNVCLMKYSYLETRSRCVNTSCIIFCFIYFHNIFILLSECHLLDAIMLSVSMFNVLAPLSQVYFFELVNRIVAKNFFF